MGIAFVTETWQPYVDGVVTRLSHTVEDLARRGHEVLVVAPTQGAPIAGVTQVRVGGAVVPMIDWRRRWARPDRRVLSEVAAFGPDVVHVVSPVLMGTWAVRRLAGRVPVVASLHTDLVAYAGRYHLGAARPVLRALNRAAYRQADLCLATSPTGVRLLNDAGVRRPRIWPAAVDDQLFRYAPPGGGPRPDGRRPLEVLCVGRLAREKGYDLLRPLVSPGADEPGLRLTFVGDGPDRSRLRGVFRGTAATFVGPVRGQALVAAYRAADVLAFTSRTETVGLVLLEAAALGRPVVAVDSPTVRDTLAGYRRARYVVAAAGPREWRDAFDAAVGSATPDEDEAPAWHSVSWAESTDELLASYAMLLPAATSVAVGRPGASPSG